MRALLLLYTDAAAGGLGFDAAQGARDLRPLHVDGLHGGAAGRLIADRLIGQRKAVLYGGIIIASGHFSMAIPSMVTFYLGLVLIVIGTGLLKGNVSVIVGQLYSAEDNRRDAGFSIFYMGINLGAFLAPLICGYLGQRVSWHAGSAPPAWDDDRRRAVPARRAPSRRQGVAARAGGSPQAAPTCARAPWWGGLFFAAMAIIGIGGYTGTLPVTAVGVADAAGVLLLLSTVVFFGWLLTSGAYTRERKRLVVVAVLFLASALFWSVFEQAGSTLNLFADRNTDTSIFGMPFPSSWFQSVNSFFIFTLAPVFAWIWVALAARPGADESRQVRLRPGRRRPRLPDSGRAGQRRGGRRQGEPALAHRDLSAAHDRRADDQSRGPQRDDAPCAGAHRRHGDGRVVPRHVGRQLHRRPRRRVLRVDGAADALRRRRRLCDCGGARAARLRRPAPADDGSVRRGAGPLILLLSTYDLGRQPLALASAAAWLRRAGLDVRVCDLAVDRLPAGALDDVTFAAVSLPMHTATRLALPVLRTLKARRPDVPLCAFGLYAPLNEARLRADGVDVVLGPECEDSLVAAALAAHGRPAAAPAAPTSPSARARALAVVPDRAGLPELERYAHVRWPDGREGVAGVAEASRGCKHTCRHCPIVPVYEGRFVAVPADVVLADIRAQVAAGATHITFADPDFFNGPTHALRLVEALHHEWPALTYDATIKVEHLRQTTCCCRGSRTRVARS
jgi:MFS family permease